MNHPRMQLLPAVMEAHRRATVEWLREGGILLESWQNVSQITEPDIPANAYVPTSVSVDYPDLHRIVQFQTPLYGMTDFVLSRSGCAIEDRPGISSQYRSARLGALVMNVEAPAVFLDILGKQGGEITSLVVINATKDSPPVACDEGSLEEVRVLHPEARFNEIRAFDIASSIMVNGTPIVTPLTDDQCASLICAVGLSKPEYTDSLIPED
ncbi:MAG: hypothetical protein WBP03_03845 [Candidatus Saccharimonadales bacterium]